MTTMKTHSRRAGQGACRRRPAPLRVAVKRARGRAAALFVLPAVCLLAGCDSGEAPVPSPASGDEAVRASRLTDDPAVMDLARNVAWYTAHGSRLPRDTAQVRERVTVSQWAPAPKATADGQPVTYRPTGERTFEIVVGDPSGPAAAQTAVALAVPENVPTDMAPALFDEWWKLEVKRQQLGQLKERLEQLGG